MGAPDSPRSSQSPPPPGPQGDLEMELLGLANALYNLGTTTVNDSTKEKGGGVKQVGARVNDVVSHLAAVDEMAQHIRTMIPFQVLAEIDGSKNPTTITSERIGRVALENQFMNGKIAALTSYRDILNEALIQAFPDLESQLTAGTSSENAAVTEPSGKIGQVQR